MPYKPKDDIEYQSLLINIFKGKKEEEEKKKSEKEAEKEAKSKKKKKEKNEKPDKDMLLDKKLFQVFFDISLFNPPPIIVRLEEKQT